MVTKAEVEKVASLAKLAFAPDEIESLTSELNSVLGYIDQLKELDVTNVAPLENMNEAFESMSGEGAMNLRADMTQPCLTVEEALRNAPKSADNYFLVPKVLAMEAKTATSEDALSGEDDEKF